MRTRRNPGIFILLVFLFSTPFWVTDVLIPVQLLPGLPLSSFSVVSVLVAATILVHREEGGNGVKRLFVKSFDAVRAKAAIWYLPAILLMPCIMLLSFLATRLSGKPIPLPQISLVSTLILLVAFFIAALCEELGWSGYATDPLQERFGALWASVLLGAVWAVWHFVPLLQAH
jgi:membrane protease YdiL (CAAX protease family)